MERISETLFGLIMALTFICSLGVATGANINIQTMLIGALGCNLAWGIVDGGLYLLGSHQRPGRQDLDAPRDTAGAGSRNSAARHRRRTAAGIGGDLASGAIGIDAAKIATVARTASRSRLTKRDWTGALGLCLLSFLSTFPVVIPFLFLSDARLALRVSYAVAIVMLFCCGYVFGIRSGLRPWAAGLAMVAVGSALVGIAVALGG